MPEGAKTADPKRLRERNMSSVADPEGGFRGFKSPLQRVLFFFFLLVSTVYENSHGPGP